MMYYKTTWLVTIFLSVVNTEGQINTISVSGQKFSIYRVKTHHPFEKFRNNHSKIATDVNDLISGLPFEIEPIIQEEGWTRELVPDINSENDKINVCDESNGKCTQICENVSGKAICSCYEGSYVGENGHCTAISGDEVVLSGTSGNFIIDTPERRWIIKAPEHHVVQCIITLTTKSPFTNGFYIGHDDVDEPFSNVMVYDGRKQTNRIYGLRKTSGTREWISTGPYMNIRAQWFPSIFTLRVTYRTGTLALTIPSIASRIALTKSVECYSLTYTSKTLAVKFGDTDLTWRTPPSILTGGARWETTIFRVPQDVTFIDLNKFAPTANSKLYSFRKCLYLENHIAAFSTFEGFEIKCFNGGSLDIETGTCLCPIEYTGPYCEQESDRKCLNGGSWDNETETCLCPIGFIGPYCGEGCGPNRYGENCTAVCSLLSTKCEGVIFCTKENCSCAPGLRGRMCDKPCLKGWYGASCRQQCGKCEDNNSCDSYTGECYSGCVAGFYPPLCQQTYKALTDQPSIAEVGYTHVTLRLSFQNVTGAGEPLFYEVHYKDIQGESWSKLAPRIISNESIFNISGLLPGKHYAVRVILIDKDGGSYQTDVPQTTLTTKCQEPEKANYHFAAQKVTAHEIELEWAYTSEKNTLECEFEKFELSFLAGDENFVVPVIEREGTQKITGLLPDTEYTFQLIGETVTGKTIVPSKTIVRTLSADLGKVRDVRVVPVDVGSKFLVSWQPPWKYAEAQLRYRVTYECKKLLACENSTCPSSGEIEVQKNSVLLEHLSPHALYHITIGAMSLDDDTAEVYAVNGVTAYSAPQVIPSAAENPVLTVTNTSATIKWMPPTDCIGLNGYLNGYSYILIDKETKHTLYEGTVLENTLYASFSDLVPQHCYEAHISVATSGGTNLRNVLVIPFCTTSTAPDQVQSLQVYKRGRRMVGLRWGLPLNLYGDIESFTITYSKVGKGTKRSEVIEPKHCEAWPNLYCHTITNLSPANKYIFVVQARNKEVSTDGEPASVEAVTTEGASTPPRNLRMINATENSVLLAWEIPDNINGTLRSFVIVTEQIDMNGNSDECCDEIPLEDYRVASEEPLYTFEIPGLSPAGTYSVAVAAKTVGVGEESRITVHTFPPKPNLPPDALLMIGKEDCSSVCDTLSFRIRPADKMSGVNRRYILLLYSNSSRAQEVFDDTDVTALLHTKFGDKYQIISEYTEDEIEEQPVVTFQPRNLDLDNAEFQSQKYALVLIHDYMGNQSVDIVFAKNN